MTQKDIKKFKKQLNEFGDKQFSDRLKNTTSTFYHDKPQKDKDIKGGTMTFGRPAQMYEDIKVLSEAVMWAVQGWMILGHFKICKCPACRAFKPLKPAYKIALKYDKENKTK